MVNEQNIRSHAKRMLDQYSEEVALGAEAQALIPFPDNAESNNPVADQLFVSSLRAATLISRGANADQSISQW